MTLIYGLHYEGTFFEYDVQANKIYHDRNANYFVVGIQRFGNTQELFDRADELGVLYEYEENMQIGNMERLTSELEHFISQHDFVFLRYVWTS